MIARGVPIAAIIGILAGGGVFFGVPVWLGYADHTILWIALWSLAFAPASPGGVDLIDGLIQPRREIRSVAQQVARCATIVVQIGSIGIACYGVGRAVG